MAFLRRAAIGMYCIGLLVASRALAAQEGPILPVPIVDQDEGATGDGSWFTTAAFGEVTGDGLTDLVVARRGRWAEPGGDPVEPGRLRVFRGDGTGGFILVSELAIASDPTHLELIDTTGDGRLEALVTDGAASTLSIYAGLGGGRFELARTITTGRTPVDFALADATGDGVLDLLVCNYDHYFVGLHAGLPGGGFAPVVRINVGTRPVEMEVVDIDGDGDLDVVTADELSGTISLAINEGGAFAPVVVAATVDRPASISVADLDDDGLPELVVAGAGGARLYQNEGGVFVSSDPITASLGGSVHHVLLKDLDGNGHADLVLGLALGAEVFAGVPGGLAATGEAVLLGGGFTARSGGVFTGRLTDGGSTGRGQDLVFVERGRVSVAVAAQGGPAGPGGLWTPITIARERTDALVAGQFTDDEIPDVLITDDRGSRLLVGLGGGAFAEPAAALPIVSQGLFAARLRPGPLDDVLVLGSALRVLRADGMGGFVPRPSVVGLGRAVAVGDLDGDGDLDLAAGGPNTAAPVFNDGLGNLTPGETLDFPNFLQNIAIGDVTGDGRADILVGGGTESIFLWPGLGGGAFGARRTIDTGLRDGTSVWTIDVGDVGEAVLIQGGATAMVLMRHLDASAPTRTLLLESAERIEGVQVLDVDGDGREDFALHQRQRGTSIWLQRDGAVFETGAGFAWWAYSCDLVDATGDGHLDALLGNGVRTWLAIGQDGALPGCAADLDGDGRATVLDFLRFQNWFDAGDPRADLDGDGVLTIFDFLRFQDVFGLGC